MLRPPASLIELGKLGAYPSIRPIEDKGVYLLPATELTQKDFIPIPADSYENARLIISESVNVFEKPGVIAGKRAAGAVSTSFSIMHKIKNQIEKDVVGYATKYLEAGRKLTQDDVTRLALRRFEAAKLIKESWFPAYKFEIVEKELYDRILKLQALAAGQVNEDARQMILRQAADEISFRPIDSPINDKAIKSSIKWARRAQVVKRAFIALEIAHTFSKVYTARNLDELINAIAPSARTIVTTAVSSLASTLTTALVVSLGWTPAGWAILAIGIAAGIFTGIYIGDEAESLAKDLLWEAVDVPRSP